MHIKKSVFRAWTSLIRLGIGTSYGRWESGNEPSSCIKTQRISSQFEEVSYFQRNHSVARRYCIRLNSYARRYMQRSVDAVWGSDGCSLWELYEPHKYTGWTKCRGSYCYSCWCVLQCRDLKSFFFKLISLLAIRKTFTHDFLWANGLV